MEELYNFLVYIFGMVRVKNVKKAQEALLQVAKNNSEATQGMFHSEASNAGKEDLHEKNYVY